MALLTQVLGVRVVLVAFERSNRSAMAANDSMLSLLEVVYGDRPPVPILPFFPTGLFYCVLPGRGRPNPRARLCLLYFGYDQGRDCYKVLDAYSREVT